MELIRFKSGVTHEAPLIERKIREERISVGLGIYSCDVRFAGYWNCQFINVLTANYKKFVAALLGSVFSCKFHAIVKIGEND